MVKHGGLNYYSVLTEYLLISERVSIPSLSSSEEAMCVTDPESQPCKPGCPLTDLSSNSLTQTTLVPNHPVPTLNVTSLKSWTP